MNYMFLVYPPHKFSAITLALHISPLIHYFTHEGSTSPLTITLSMIMSLKDLLLSLTSLPKTKLANALTKRLSSATFQLLPSKVGISDGSQSLYQLLPFSYYNLRSVSCLAGGVCVRDSHHTKLHYAKSP